MLAAGRVAVGALLTIAPGSVGRLWVGDGARSPAAKIAFRAMGIRDLGLGACTLHALNTGEPVRSWVMVAAVSDSIDAAAAALGARQIPLAKSILSVAVSSMAAAAGAASLDQLD